MTAQALQLADGRRLTWEETGDPGGVPVFGFHGTPGSRWHVLVGGDAFRAAGARCIAPDRPGYGGSTFHPGRTLLGWADDVAALADHLGLDRFAVFGISGGGPHAAACASALPGRVTAAALLSGVASLQDPGSEAGMMPVNRLFARLARRLPALNRLPFGLLASAGRRFPDRLLATMAKQAPAADAAVLRRPHVADAFRRDLAEAAPTTGRAAAQDFALIARDWGFRLEDLRVPVQVWQAEADVNVPADHARRQAAAIPGAVLHLLPDEGHLMCLDHFEEIVAELTSTSG